MELTELKEKAGLIEGLCKEEDCALLYTLARDLKAQGCILEIGSYKGRITFCLAMAEKESEGGKVYSIEADLFGTKAQLLSNLERSGISGRVVNIFKHSSKANKGWISPLKMLWIDTDGNNFSLKCDFLLWERFLSEGGLIAVSCAENPGVRRFVGECLASSGRFSRISRSGSIFFAYKDKQGAVIPASRIFYTRLIYRAHFIAGNFLRFLLKFVSPKADNKNFLLKRIGNNFFEKILRV